MKNVTLFLLALLCLPLSIFAQQSEQLEDKVKAACSTLDFSKITTGILYESVPTYTDFSKMNGHLVHDSLSNIKPRFLLSYGVLDKGHVGTSTMKPTAQLWNELDELQKSDTVFLALLAYRYNRFKEDAATSGLISYSNDHLYDNSTGNQTAYLTDTTFIFSAIKNESKNKTVKFYFPDSLMFSNVGINTANLQIDFGGGAGYQSLSFNHLYTINYTSYSSDSIQRIKLKYVSATGDTLVAMTMVHIDESVNFNGGGSDRGGSDYAQTYDALKKLDGLTLYYWYNTTCDATKIRKPIILVEGFDGLNENTWNLVMNDGTDPKIETGLLDLEYGSDKNLSEYFHSGLYDIFFVDFDEGGRDLRENAEFLINAIKWINEEKHLNGSNEKNVVIGASAGGVIGKWALRKMEQRGEDHETELFMSMDSPLKGANIPMGLQAAITHLGEYKIFGIPLRNKKKELKDGDILINSKASKQLLYYHILLTQNQHVDASSLTTWHDEFYAEFDALGNLTIPHVAISNGAIDGTGQPFPAGQLLVATTIYGSWFYETIKWYDNFWKKFGLNTFNLSVGIWALADNNVNDHKVYDGMYVHSVLGFPIFTNSGKFVKMSKPYDSAPGGLRKNESSFSPFYKSFCFIPTISSIYSNIIDPYHRGINLLNMQGNVNSGLVQVRAYHGATTVGTWYDQQQINQQHVKFDNGSANFLKSWILDRSSINEIPNDVLGGRDFNFGKATTTQPDGSPQATTNEITKKVVLNNQGRIYINNSGRIDFQDVLTNPANSVSSSFDVRVTKDFCTGVPASLTLNNGGWVLIGDPLVDNAGKLTFEDQTQLIINSGGKLSASKASNLILNAGATAVVNAGGYLIGDYDGKIVLKSGSTLRLKSGSFLLLKQSAFLVVETGATLIIESGAEFIFSDTDHADGSCCVYTKSGGNIVFNGSPVITGNGYFRFEAGHIFTMNSSLDLQGIGKEKRLVFLETDAQLIVTKDFNLRDCKVEYDPNSNIFSTNNIRLNFNSVYFKGPNARTTVALNLAYTKQLDINNCAFKYLGFGISMQNLNSLPGAYQINQSEFFNNANGGIQILNSSGCKVSQSSFYGQQAILAENVKGIYMLNGSQVYKIKSDDISGVVLTNVGHFELNASTISGFDHGSGIWGVGRTNVKMYEKATIQNCQFGVSMIGGQGTTTADYGALTMRCSNLLQNDYGVIGTDILLDIDNGIQAFGKNANTFVIKSGNPDSKIFQIDYVQRNISTVYARGNYWQAPSSTPTAYSLTNLTTGFVNLVTTPVETSMPTLASCQGGGTPGGTPGEKIYSTANGTDCEIVRNGHTVVIHDLYSSATAQYDAENYELAELGYAPIAEITRPERNTMSTNCRLYIDMAKCRTFVPLALHQDQLEDRGSKDLTNSAMTITPNPASGVFVVSLLPSQQGYDLDVIDVLGRVVYTERDNMGQFSITVVNWSSGLYSVVVKDHSTGKVMTSKVVIDK